jgi:UDP-2,3-diacylglucosamine pyrophosphatase LpxH
LGDRCYEILLSFNEVFNWVRRVMGMRYWSISKYIKIKVKRATQFVESFETVVCRYAKENGYDGVICGHLHEPKVKIINGIVYANTGCWTEKDNCSFLYEDENGDLQIGNQETR